MPMIGVMIVIVDVARAKARLRRRLAKQDGFTLVELIVAMAILLIILAPLTASFASAMTAQVDQTNRFDAQENARQALDRMRIAPTASPTPTRTPRAARPSFSPRRTPPALRNVPASSRRMHRLSSGARSR